MARSLVTTLRAAEQFSVDHLRTPEISALIDGASFFYIGGFFLTHGIESALEVAKKGICFGGHREECYRGRDCGRRERCAVGAVKVLLPQDGHESSEAARNELRAYKSGFGLRAFV